MALVVLCGFPGSGKTLLASNLESLFEASHHPCEIVSETRVEEGNYTSTRLETQGRSDFKASIRRALAPDKIIIADGLNFIKGFRYELFCIAREQNLRFCCCFCDVDPELARERSISRYGEKVINDLLGRMETPTEKNKWDKPLFVVKDSNDKEMLNKIVETALSKSSQLSTKKATQTAIASASVNDKIDKEVNKFCEELLRIQTTAPVGSKVTICGVPYLIKKQLNSGQLKRAKREFADRAKSMTDIKNIPELFAQSLQILF